MRPRTAILPTLVAVIAIVPFRGSSSEPSQYSVLYSFPVICCYASGVQLPANGAQPQGSLTLGTDGFLYGTAYGGGSFVNYSGVANCYNTGCGTIFKVNTSGGFTLLHTFQGTDGAWPTAEVIQAKDGYFYGTASGGGVSSCVNGGVTGCGTVFRVDASGNFTVLHAFNGTEGAFPNGRLIQAADGYFYGTTSAGGNAVCNVGGIDCGTVFKMDTLGNITVLHAFSKSDGGHPLAGLVQATDGFFYGTTSAGGVADEGIVFRMDGQGDVTVLHSFTGPDGIDPVAPLIQASDGAFYSATHGGTGGALLGMIFKINTTGTFTALHAFTGPDGQFPTGAALIQGSDGALYGTTPFGGTANLGTVYRMDLFGNITVLQSFTGANGANPQGGLVQASSSFFGSASSGGVSNDGVLYVMPNTLSGATAVVATQSCLIDSTRTQLTINASGTVSGPNGTQFGLGSTWNGSPLQNSTTTDSQLISCGSWQALPYAPGAPFTGTYACQQNGLAPNTTNWTGSVSLRFGVPFTSGAVQASVIPYFNGTSTPAPPLVDCVTASCNPPRTLFADDSGAGGLANTELSHQGLSGGLLQEDVLVQNHVRFWLTASATGDSPTNPLLVPNLGAGLPGKAALFGLVPPCASGFSFTPPFVNCSSPGAAAWIVKFCSPGIATLTLSVTTTSIATTLAGLLLKQLPIVQADTVIIDISNQLYSNVPLFKTVVDCIAKGPTLSNSACVGSALLELDFNPQQQAEIISVLAKEGITVGVSELIDLLLHVPLDVEEWLGDMIIYNIQTRSVGHVGTEIIKIIGH